VLAHGQLEVSSLRIYVSPLSILSGAETLMNDLDGGVTLVDHLGRCRLVRATRSPTYGCTYWLSVECLEGGHADRSVITTVVREL
jgi:hypothetical protein